MSGFSIISFSIYWYLQKEEKIGHKLKNFLFPLKEILSHLKYSDRAVKIMASETLHMNMQTKFH